MRPAVNLQRRARDPRCVVGGEEEENLGDLQRPRPELEGQAGGELFDIDPRFRQ